MEYASHARHLLVAALFLLLLLLQQKHADSANLPTTDPKSDTGNSVKKERPQSPHETTPTVTAVTPKPIIITERPAPPNAADAANQVHAGTGSKSTGESPHNAQGGNVDFPETYTAVFYVLVGITSSAILLLIVRVYR